MREKISSITGKLMRGVETDDLIYLRADTSNKFEYSRAHPYLGWARRNGDITDPWSFEIQGVQMTANHDRPSSLFCRTMGTTICAGLIRSRAQWTKTSFLRTKKFSSLASGDCTKSKYLASNLSFRCMAINLLRETMLCPATTSSENCSS